MVSEFFKFINSSANVTISIIIYYISIFCYTADSSMIFLEQDKITLLNRILGIKKYFPFIMECIRILIEDQKLSKKNLRYLIENGWLTCIDFYRRLPQDQMVVIQYIQWLDRTFKTDLKVVLINIASAINLVEPNDRNENSHNMILEMSSPIPISILVISEQFLFVSVKMWQNRRHKPKNTFFYSASPTDTRQDLFVLRYVNLVVMTKTTNLSLEGYSI